LSIYYFNLPWSSSSCVKFVSPFFYTTITTSSANLCCCTNLNLRQSVLLLAWREAIKQSCNCKGEAIDDCSLFTPVGGRTHRILAHPADFAGGGG
jgi:hypothetical protein